MKHLRIYMFIMGATVSLFCMTSCRKFLAMKPSNNFVVPASLQDVRALLDNANELNFKSPTQGEGSADDYYMTNSRFDNIDHLMQARYIWDYAYIEGSNLADWQRLYYGVYLVNVALETLTIVEKDSANFNEWNELQAMAKVYRANLLLRGVWIFGKAYNPETSTTDPGMVLRTVTDISVPTTRSSVQETYEFILKDLKESIRYLPHRQGLATRPSRAAAYGLLARTYLSMREYEKAGSYADSCLMIQSELMDFNNDIVISPNADAQNPFGPFDKEVIFSTASSVLSMYTMHSGYGRIDTTLLQSYEHGDLRKAAYFRDIGDGEAELRGKFSDFPLFTGITAGEMYLIRAEYLIRDNQIKAGLSDLNKLRKHRFLLDFYESIELSDGRHALQTVLDERRKELVMRDLRWMDVKRLNLEGANIVLKRVVDGVEHLLLPNDPKFACPLPNEIILHTGIRQNKY